MIDVEDLVEKTETAITEIKNKLFDKMNDLGVVESARRLGINKGYISRILKDKQNPTYEKIIDFYKKLVK